MLLATAACSPPPATEIVLVVDGDPWAIANITSFDFDITNAEKIEDECARWPRTLAFVPREPPPRDLNLEIIGQDHGGFEVARAKVIASYEVDTIAVLRDRLTRDCTLDQSCTFDHRGAVIETAMFGQTLVPEEDDNEPPGLGILFPPEGANTVPGFITLTATATDRHGIEDVTGATREGCAEFRRGLPLEAGRRTLTAEAQDTRGNVRTFTRNIEVLEQQLLPGPFGLYVPPAGTIGYSAFSTALREVDLTTGTFQLWPSQTSFSKFAAGRTPTTIFATNRRQIFELDLDTRTETAIAGGIGTIRQLVWDERRARIIATRNESILFNEDDLIGLNFATRDVTTLRPGSGGTFGSFTITGLAIDPVNDRLYASVFERGSHILEINLATFEEEERTCTNDPEAELAGVVWDRATSKLIAIDERDPKVIEIDPATWTCRELSGPNRGRGPELITAETPNLGAGDRIYVLDRNERVIVEVDRATGDRRALPKESIGTGPPLATGSDARVARNGDIFVVTNFGLVRVRASDGRRTLIAGKNRGSGPNPRYWAGIDVDREEKRALIVDSVENTILGVDLTTGDRTILFGPDGVAPDPDLTGSVVFGPDERTAYLFDRAQSSLIAVYLPTGEQSLLSGPMRGEGERFEVIDGIALDAAGGRLIITESIARRLTAVDLESGDRRPLPMIDPLLVAGTPEHIALDPQGRSVLTIVGADVLISMNLETGAQAAVSTELRTPGHPLNYATCLAVDWRRRVAYVCDVDLAALTAIDMRDGHRAVMSR